MLELNLRPNLTPAALAKPIAPDGWRLEIPAGQAGRYRLAQLDDYTALPRASFPWKPPFHLEVRLRASAPDLPGTWGFGLWNDPFVLSLGLGGGSRRFPALPNAAWFFFASQQNYLSFRDDLPARGFLAATFASPAIPAPLLALGSLALPTFMVPFLSQLLRRVVRRFVRQDAALLPIDPTGWHAYALDWQAGKVTLSVDGIPALDTPVSPQPPLGLVFWIDNQYAALPPAGGLRYGFLANQDPAWIEILLDNPIATR